MARLVAGGSFGFFSPTFAVTEESVTLSRKRVLLLFVALIPLGPYVIALPFIDHDYAGRGNYQLAFAFGVLLIVFGVRGFLGSPLMPPSRVRISGAGVDWGSRRLSPAEITGVDVDSVGRRARYGMIYTWSLVLARSGAPALRFRLTTSGDAVVPPDVDRVLTAARGLLAPGEGEAPAGLPQWAPAGSSPKALTAPLTEPTFRQHLAEGREIERALYGKYTVIALDVKTGPRVMKYRYRLLVLPREGADPVLAVNLEQSPFGTSALGVHNGGVHVNYGEASPDMPYEAFRERARAILGEELLGIRAN